jgi:hypothetical protein
MHHRRGFTLIELLIALNLSMVVIHLMVFALSSLRYPSSQIDVRQNLNGVYQLRQRLALCRVKKVERRNMFCTFDHQEHELRFEDDRLVMRPGYVVYLENLEAGFFEEQDKVIHVTFTTEGEEVHAVLGMLE